MKTGILVGLAVAAVLGVGVVAASGVMAPAGGMQSGMQGGMGNGMMGGGPGMHGGDMMNDGTCTCQTHEDCQQHMYDDNHSGDHGGMMP